MSLRDGGMSQIRHSWHLRRAPKQIYFAVNLGLSALEQSCSLLDWLLFSVLCDRSMTWHLFFFVSLWFNICSLSWQASHWLAFFWRKIFLWYSQMFILGVLVTYYGTRLNKRHTLFYFYFVTISFEGTIM